MATDVSEKTELRAVFVSDGEKPERMRGAVRTGPSRLCVDLVAEKHSQLREIAIEFRLYRGRRLLLPFTSWLAASFGRPLPVAADNFCVQAHRPGRARLSIDPPSPLDFTLHLYGPDEFMRSIHAAFVAAPDES
jgi:hypothetical protein